MSSKLNEQTKKIIKERAKHCCEYCACPYDFANQFFSIEHIIPKSKKGTNNLQNLAYACQCCNGHKYNKTKGLDPINHKMTSLFNPRQDKWQEHSNGVKIFYI
jgi:5-methylcytosine-specific restriction endonuclease McrA